jgi:hypothetical protein
MKEYSMEELLPIVSKLIRKYTSMESTSIPNEKARQLMQAVQYCMNHSGDKELWDIHRHIRACAGISQEIREETRIRNKGQHSTAQKAYDQGYENIIQKVKAAKEIYEMLIIAFDSYQNECYYDTIVKGIPEFFRWYEPKFCPQDHILTLDYPVLVSIEHLHGIDRIYSYLMAVYIEQQFLSIFPRQNVVNLLNRYMPEAEEGIFNISEVVLTSVIGCMIEENRIEELTIESYEQIRLLVESVTKDQLRHKLEVFLELFLLHTPFHKEIWKEEAMKDYFGEAVKGLASLLKRVEGNGRYEDIFP